MRYIHHPFSSPFEGREYKCFPIDECVSDFPAVLGPKLLEISTSKSARSYLQSMLHTPPACLDSVCLNSALVSISFFGLKVNSGSRFLHVGR